MFAFASVQPSDFRSALDKSSLNPLSTNSTKWSDTFKQFVDFCRRIVWVFDHFMGLALKGLKRQCTDAEFLRLEVSVYITAQDQISTPTDLSVFVDS